MEAQKLGGFDTFILATSWIFVMASRELSTTMFYKNTMVSDLKRWLGGGVRPLKASGGVLRAAWSCLWEALGLSWAPLRLILTLLGGFGASWGCLARSWP